MKNKNLTEYEQLNLKIHHMLKNGMTRKQILKKLKVSPWKLDRKIKEYKNNNGVVMISHGNKGRAPINKLPDELIEFIADDFEKANENLHEDRARNVKIRLKGTVRQFNRGKIEHDFDIKNVKYSTVRRRVEQIGKLGTSCNRSINRSKKAVEKNAITYLNRKINGSILYSNKLNLESIKAIKKVIKRIKKSKEEYPFGMIVELDASKEYYFPKSYRQKVTIHVAVDSSGMILGIVIGTNETKMKYIELLELIFKRYGLPTKIITDRRMEFAGHGDNSTELAIIMKKLGIQLITSSNPTDKGNVEGTIGKLQSFLPEFLHYNNISNPQEFEKHIDEFIQEFNETYDRKPHRENVFKKFDDDTLDVWVPKVFKSFYLTFDQKDWIAKTSKNETYMIEHNKTVLIKVVNQKIIMNIDNKYMELEEINIEQRTTLEYLLSMKQIQTMQLQEKMTKNREKGRWIGRALSSKDRYIETKIMINNINDDSPILLDKLKKAKDLYYSELDEINREYGEIWNY